MKIGIVSGHFTFLHFGHIEYINASKIRCDKLIVIVNNDLQIKLKGTISPIDENHRVNIIKNLRSVDDCILSIDTDESVSNTLIKIRNAYPNDNLAFFNSGDRTTAESQNTKEHKICEEYNIKYVAIPLPKIYSSSQLKANLS
jgi:cytidyltransferase-like protein